VGGLGAIARLVRDGVAFERYRAPTTVVSGVMASLLTGTSPRAHGLEDPTGRLADEARLISERAREGNVHAAFFTGVPMSFPPFGFDRGWERSETFSPVRDLPATEPLSRAMAWLKEQLASDRDRKLLVVVHARGGHPPWDVSRDEVQLLPPAEYGGNIEPRAGALVLGNLRGLRSPQDQRLSGDDWRRLRALEEAALRKEDAALRRLFEVLDREGLYDDALLVLVGDVATGDPPLIPFGPMPPLREDVLSAPLLVKFPRGLLAGKQVSALATAVDVTRTVVESLDLPPDGLDGVSLGRLAVGALPLDGRPLVATLGTRYSTRYGPWLLTGELGRKPTLCLVEVDPSCATDALAQSPLAGEALWRRTFEAETRGAHEPAPEDGKVPRASLDAETQSALKVFGY
jgi:arylsulfatase A-like enzyme